MQRIFALAEVGAIDGGGCNRLALTDADRDGRDVVVGWMRDLGLEVAIDAVGNVIGTWNVGTGAAVMTGSHIDTVRTGGKNLGVALAHRAEHLPEIDQILDVDIGIALGVGDRQGQ